MRIYLDAVSAIYWVERIPPYIDRLRARFAPDGTLHIVSELTRLESRIKPIRDGDSQLLRAFDDYFGLVVSEIVPLSRQVVDLATNIRAEYRFKTPDALHLAAAVSSGCDLFLTHDRRLSRFRELPVEIL